MKQLEFLTMLFGDAENGRICIWRKDNKQTARFDANKKGIKAAAAYAAKEGEKVDVYVGCGLQPEGPSSPGERGKAATVEAIPGVWADIDVGDHGNGKNYLPDLGAAQRFLAGLPIKPTLVVATGGGVHAWWLFEELFDITGDEERAEAQQIVGRWQTFLRRQLVKYDMDSTYDLARVLRIPGTFNHKDGDKKGVVLLGETGPRTNPSDLMDFAPEVVVAITDSMESKGGKCDSLIESKDAAPPTAKLIAMQDDTKFKRTWERKRTDMKDQSASSYCLSLANMAAMSGWSDQEICDLLIHWRSIHCPDNMKFNHMVNGVTWYMDRVMRAREATGVGPSAQHAIETVAEVAAGDSVKESDLLGSLSEITGIKIIGIIKRVVRDKTGFVQSPTYVLDIQKKPDEAIKVVLPNVDWLIDQGKFRRIAAEQTGALFNRMKGPQWDNVARSLLAVCVEVADVPEAGNLENVRNLLSRYMTEASISTDLSDAFNADCCYRAEDGTIQFPWNGFSSWATTIKTHKMNNADLSRALQGIGCERIAYDRRGKAYSKGRLKATFWKMPEEL